MKHLLVLFAFILVSLAPVYADEGYIPYFPDFLEPDGIGFRGPASIRASNCWADFECVGEFDIRDAPKGTTFAAATSYTKSSPVKLEYNKKYFFKKLFYTQVFADFGQTLTDATLRYPGNWYADVIINSDPFLKDFLTAEEKSKISSLLLDGSNYRIFNLKTESTFIFFGAGFGLDLWLLEGSWGPFLMLHDTSLNLRACRTQNFKGESDLESSFFIPQICNLFPNDMINLDKQRYFGFAAGTVTDLSIVFLQTENWRISMDTTTVNFNLFLDSNFKPVSYRGLKFYPEYSSSSTLKCSGGRYRYYSTAQPSGEWQDIDCINSKGEDHHKSSDYTYGLKITYYFR